MGILSYFRVCLWGCCCYFGPMPCGPQDLHLDLHSGITPGRLNGLYEVSGIKPSWIYMKTNCLPTALSFWTLYTIFVLSQMEQYLLLKYITWLFHYLWYFSTRQNIKLRPKKKTWYIHLLCPFFLSCHVLTRYESTGKCLKFSFQIGNILVEFGLFDNLNLVVILLGYN